MFSRSPATFFVEPLLWTTVAEHCTYSAGYERFTTKLSLGSGMLSMRIDGLRFSSQIFQSGMYAKAESGKGDSVEMQQPWERFVSDMEESMRKRLYERANGVCSIPIKGKRPTSVQMWTFIQAATSLKLLQILCEPL